MTIRGEGFSLIIFEERQSDSADRNKNERF